MSVLYKLTYILFLFVPFDFYAASCYFFFSLSKLPFSGKQLAQFGLRKRMKRAFLCVYRLWRYNIEPFEQEESV